MGTPECVGGWISRTGGGCCTGECSNNDETGTEVLGNISLKLDDEGVSKRYSHNVYPNRSESRWGALGVCWGQSPGLTVNL